MFLFVVMLHHYKEDGSVEALVVFNICCIAAQSPSASCNWRDKWPGQYALYHLANQNCLFLIFLKLN